MESGALEQELENVGLPDLNEIMEAEKAKELGLAPESEEDENPEIQEEMQLDNEEILNQERERILNQAKDMGYDDTKFDKNHPRYISPYEYVRYGKLREDSKNAKEELDRQNGEINQRLENFQRLADARADQQIKDAQSQLQKARDDYDMDAYDAANQNLQAAQNEKYNLNTQPQAQPQQPVKAPETLAWEARNKWVHDITDPRTKQANDAYLEFKSTYKQATEEQALQYVDNKMGLNNPQQQSPQVNPRREVAPMNDTRREPRAEKRTGNLSMADLTPSEKMEWETQKHDIWLTLKDGESKFLRAIKDSRKIRGE